MQVQSIKRKRTVCLLDPSMTWMGRRARVAKACASGVANKWPMPWSSPTSCLPHYRDPLHDNTITTPNHHSPQPIPGAPHAGPRKYTFTPSRLLVQACESSRAMSLPMPRTRPLGLRCALACQFAAVQAYLQLRLITRKHVDQSWRRSSRTVNVSILKQYSTSTWERLKCDTSS